MRILIAEDDAVSRRLLEAKLTKWGYDVVITCNGEEAWNTLRAKDAPSMAVLDWMMPEIDGVEVCRRVRKESREPYTYIILLTTLQREEDIVIGMEAGADDYITKPFRSNELKVRLRAGRRILELQDELIEAREVLRAKAIHDPLTGLCNHEEILQILGIEMERAAREGTCVGVLMADLDHFKTVNDTYGHQAGDAVLRLTAKRMTAVMRPYDAIGRYGGEEFLLVAPGCDSESIFDLAERLRLCICHDAMDTPEGIISCRISIGAAVSSGQKRADMDSLIREADTALYRAKEKGRNRVEVSCVVVEEKAL
ncbi:MAG: diguanylate cyclase [Thermodesulfovibrionales bacterium]